MFRAADSAFRALVLGSACALSVVACGPAAQEPEDVAPITTELALRDGMRALWVDHATWTHQYLISAISNLPDADEAAARLLQNQTDIGNAIKPFYGEDAGNALTGLLNDHITIATEIVAAAKAGNTTALDDARARWTTNADEISAFLASANPNWPLADVQSMMRGHLDQTLAEATALLTGDANAEIQAYDEIVDHLMHMADVLSDGLIAQFPDLISPDPASERDQARGCLCRPIAPEPIRYRECDQAVLR
jgi:hypothetical protein